VITFTGTDRSCSFDVRLSVILKEKFTIREAEGGQLTPPKRSGEVDEVALIVNFSPTSWPLLSYVALQLYQEGGSLKLQGSGSLFIYVFIYVLIDLLSYLYVYLFFILFIYLSFF
jgi:hypothetical protein